MLLWSVREECLQVAANLLASTLPKIVIPNIEHFLPNEQGVIKITRVSDLKVFPSVVLLESPFLDTDVS